MKILGGIPTRARDTSFSIAKQLLEVAEKVYIVAQEIKLPESDNHKIVIKYQSPGLRKARNTILELAQLEKAKFVLQCDDDLKFLNQILHCMEKEMLLHPWLGAIGSTASVYYHWNKNFRSNLNLRPIPNPAQLWMLRMEAVQEIGNFYCEALEDIEYGLRLWKFGWGVAALHISQDATHKPFIPRLNKSKAMGGQPIDERNELMPKAIEQIKDRYSSNVLKSLKIGKKTKQGSYTYHIRYNWDEMFRRLSERWGHIGYKDNRGIHL
jgi:hypothetical protein